MSNNNDVEFPNGLFFKLPHENAPDFVKGRLSIKVDDLKEYLENKDEEWLNIDLKISKQGKAYAQINTFKPKQQDHPVSDNEPLGSDVDMNNIDEDDDLPF